MSASHTVAIGIDIGGTHTKLGLVDSAGNISAFRRIPTEAQGTDPLPFVTRLLAQIDELLAAAKGPVAGLGVSMHGELDDDRRGPIIAGNTPALRNFDMRGTLERHYRLPVDVYNDLTAHSLGEYYFGTGRGVERFMCLAIGTGLGAGVIVKGKPLIIDGGNSGNTGLIILDPQGPVDHNGIRGSAEGLCGVRGIERLARERYGRDVPAYNVIAAAREGNDPIASGIIRQIGAYLGQTLASLSVIFYPHRIALTGGTAAAGPVLLAACQESFEALVGPFFRDIAANTRGHFREVEIVLGEQGNETGLLGAVIALLGLSAP
ncbi:MAG: ROK family protein [Anaerolineae bacterium]|nr:ROK family protein [Anaerolineae bacterium]